MKTIAAGKFKAIGLFERSNDSGGCARVGLAAGRLGGATTLIYKARLVTKDASIHKSAEVEYIW